MPHPPDLTAAAVLVSIYHLRLSSQVNLGSQCAKEGTCLTQLRPPDELLKVEVLLKVEEHWRHQTRRSFQLCG